MGTKICESCYESFTQRKGWEELCFFCWKDKKDNVDGLQDQVSDLQLEVSRLRERNSEIRRELDGKVGKKLNLKRYGIYNFDEDLKRIIFLCHPDKNNGSKLMNEVMSIINNLREKTR